MCSVIVVVSFAISAARFMEPFGGLHRARTIEMFDTLVKDIKDERTFIELLGYHTKSHGQAHISPRC